MLFFYASESFNAFFYVNTKSTREKTANLRGLEKKTSLKWETITFKNTKPILPRPTALVFLSWVEFFQILVGGSVVYGWAKPFVKGWLGWRAFVLLLKPHSVEVLMLTYPVFN